jgi:hypothetical protein
MKWLLISVTRTGGSGSWKAEEKAAYERGRPAELTMLAETLLKGFMAVSARMPCMIASNGAVMARRILSPDLCSW